MRLIGGFAVLFTDSYDVINFRYLETGDSYTTVADIVPDVTEAEEFLPVPKAADWQEDCPGLQGEVELPRLCGSNRWEACGERGTI